MSPPSHRKPRLSARSAWHLPKPAAVSARRPAGTVIGSDQVAVCKGEQLEKPGDAERCQAQLRWLSASAATFYYRGGGAARASWRDCIQFVDTTTVYFRTLSSPEIERYLAAEKPFDCAGGFRAEALGISLFARVVSEDPTALIGLPLIALARVLRQLGYELP
jgi:septum formation protein